MKNNALIAVYQKDDRVVEFCRRLTRIDWNLIATPGTSEFLARNGVDNRSIEILIGSSRLGDRVVTLAREVHEALLCDEVDEQWACTSAVPAIGLVVVEMFPLQAQMIGNQAFLDTLLRSVDVGGAALIRSAVKGNRIVVTDLDDCMSTIEWVESQCPNRDIVRTRLQVKAELTVAQSCCASVFCREAAEKLRSESNVAGFRRNYAALP